MSGGDNLRAIRERLGLTLRDVEKASQRLSEKYGNSEYLLTISRVSDIETKGVLPTLFRLYSFAVIYRYDLHELLSIYGIAIRNLAGDAAEVEIPRTHKCDPAVSLSDVRVPVRVDPGFDPRSTTNIGRMIMKWGAVPYSMVSQFESTDYTYGYIGLKDLTMYPLLLPGTFVQVNIKKTRIAEQPWRSEYERPIYFLETRDGYVCCWCERDGERIILLSHPLSPVKSRAVHFEQDVDVVGQVVAIAMRLEEWAPLTDAQQPARAGSS